MPRAGIGKGFSLENSGYFPGRDSKSLCFPQLPLTSLQGGTRSWVPTPRRQKKTEAAWGQQFFRHATSPLHGLRLPCLPGQPKDITAVGPDMPCPNLICPLPSPIRATQRISHRPPVSHWSLCTQLAVLKNFYFKSKFRKHTHTSGSPSVKPLPSYALPVL